MNHDQFRNVLEDFYQLNSNRNELNYDKKTKTKKNCCFFLKKKRIKSFFIRGPCNGSLCVCAPVEPNLKSGTASTHTLQKILFFYKH